MWKFYISHLGQQFGPLSVDDIYRHIQMLKFNHLSYLYDENKKAWTLLSNHPLFTFAFASLKIIETENQPQLANGISDQKEWFVLKDKTKYGPFIYFDLIKFLQKKNLYSFDYVWKNGWSGWVRISECEAFQPDVIAKMANSNNPEVKNLFYLRRYVRAKYDSRVFLHDRKTVSHGQSQEISFGGAGIVTNNPNLQPNQNLLLHFKVGEEVPPFNAIGSIVSKLPLDNQKETKYGVKFTNISKEVQQAIKNYAEKKGA